MCCREALELAVLHLAVLAGEGEPRVGMIKRVSELKGTLEVIVGT
jgi:hypothetical protein